VITTLLAGLAVLVAVAGLGLGVHGVALLGVALADAALVALVVRELREVDDLDRYPDRIGAAPAQVAVLDELLQVLAALFADFAVPFEVLSQSHW
jgi:hypothetical protein